MKSSKFNIAPRLRGSHRVHRLPECLELVDDGHLHVLRLFGDRHEAKL